MRAELRAVPCQSFCAPTDARPWRILRSKSFSQEHDKKRGTAVGNLLKTSYKVIQCRFLVSEFPIIFQHQASYFLLSSSFFSIIVSLLTFHGSI